MCSINIEVLQETNLLWETRSCTVQELPYSFTAERITENWICGSLYIYCASRIIAL